MPGISINMEGLDKTLAKLDVKKLSQDIEGELHAFGMNVMQDAISNVSKTKFIELMQAIKQEPLPMAVKVVVLKSYAAYVEFGTGRFAALYVPSIEPEWQAYARTFYINGQGRLPASPYLYPAFEKNKIELIKRLKTLLNA